MNWQEFTELQEHICEMWEGKLPDESIEETRELVKRIRLEKSPAELKKEIPKDTEKKAVKLFTQLGVKV